MVGGGEEDRTAELNPRTRTCTVIGGRGFAGGSLVARLLTHGKWTVRVADSTQSPPPGRDSLLSHALSSGRASCHRLDVRDKSLVADAIEGSSVVFYFADSDTNSDDFYRSYVTIVQGAKNVVEACRECKVRRLIYNSSADVVLDDLRDVINGDESLPYAYKFEHGLNELKAQAEAIILSANSIDGLLTCAIRPCNVFGPSDSVLVPFFVSLARSSWTKFIIGSGTSVSDFTYVENVAHAHICAEESLDFRTAAVAGKAFFISNLCPMKFWDFSSPILEGLGYQSPAMKIPARMLGLIILVIHWMHRKWGLFKWNHSVFHNIQLALYSRTFNCSAAQKHIGYSPVVPLKEGVSRTIKSFSHLVNDNSLSRYCDRDGPSKAEKLLGPGNVAEILLWRDEKKSFTCFLVSVMMFNWFFLSGRTFTSSLAKFVLLVVCLLFGYGVLPPDIFGYRIKKMSSSCFEIPEVVLKESVTEIVRKWNRGFFCIRSLAEQQDWKIFFKVTTFLYFLKLVLSYSFTTIIGIALVLSFTAFFVYEQYESEIDGLAKLLFGRVKKLVGLLKRNLPHSVASVLCNNGVDEDNYTPSTVKPW